MVAEIFELVGRPTPVLQHLRGRFDKVAYDVCAMEAGEFGPADEIVNPVSELVEESDDFIVLQQARLAGCGRGEVANKGCSRVAARTIFFEKARLKVEICGVLVFVRAGV